MSEIVKNTLVLDKNELLDFYSLKTDIQILSFWKGQLVEMPKEFCAEAQQLSFILMPFPFVSSDILSDYYSFKILGGSRKLQEYMNANDLFVVIHKD